MISNLPGKGRTEARTVARVVRGIKARTRGMTEARMARTKAGMERTGKGQSG